LPAEDHARFQARGTTMRREVQAILKAQFAHRGGLLTEDCLCVRVSPEPKRQLTDYGRERRMNVADLARAVLLRVLASER
jgi:hypothetical protein